jgi:hypothetical protein
MAGWKKIHAQAGGKNWDAKCVNHLFKNTFSTGQSHAVSNENHWARRVIEHLYCLDRELAEIH